MLRMMGGVINSRLFQSESVMWWRHEWQSMTSSLINGFIQPYPLQMLQCSVVADTAVYLWHKTTFGYIRAPQMRLKDDTDLGISHIYKDSAANPYQVKQVFHFLVFHQLSLFLVLLSLVLFYSCTCVLLYYCTVVFLYTFTYNNNIYFFKQ